MLVVFLTTLWGRWLEVDAWKSTLYIFFFFFFFFLVYRARYYNSLNLTQCLTRMCSRSLCRRLLLENFLVAQLRFFFTTVSCKEGLVGKIPTVHVKRPVYTLYRFKLFSYHGPTCCLATSSFDYWSLPPPSEYEECWVKEVIFNLEYYELIVSPKGGDSCSN